jgi:hypothetical protein
MLKDIVLLEGPLLYVLCEGAVQVMNMCDSKLFLPTSMEAARSRQLKYIGSIQGYFDHVAW